MNILSRVRTLLWPSPWKPARIGVCSGAGGVYVLNGTIHVYTAAQLLPGCIVYSGCPVWVHAVSGQISTRDPATVPAAVNAE